MIVLYNTDIIGTIENVLYVISEKPMTENEEYMVSGQGKYCLILISYKRRIYMEGRRLLWK